MTQHKHTPGPWELRQSVRNGYFFLDHEKGGENYTHVIFKECEKNDAILMSAAHDLLRALQKLRDLPIDCSQQEDLAAWKLANEAIRKATGATP